jgi:hypothetical protein
VLDVDVISAGKLKVSSSRAGRRRKEGICPMRSCQLSSEKGVEMACFFAHFSAVFLLADLAN